MSIFFFFKTIKRQLEVAEAHTKGEGSAQRPSGGDPAAQDPDFLRFVHAQLESRETYDPIQMEVLHSMAGPNFQAARASYDNLLKTFTQWFEKTLCALMKSGTFFFFLPSRKGGQPLH